MCWDCVAYRCTWGEENRGWVREACRLGLESRMVFFGWTGSWRSRFSELWVLLNSVTARAAVFWKYFVSCVWTRLKERHIFLSWEKGLLWQQALLLLLFSHSLHRINRTLIIFHCAFCYTSCVRLLHRGRQLISLGYRESWRADR